MKISIITVNYKSRDKIINSYESIINNSKFKDLEYIIVDNENDIELKKFIKNKKNIIYIASENNGFGAANNLGAKVAKGDYLLFLNPDTIVQALAIEKMYAVLNDNNKVGMVSPLLVDKHLKPFEQQSRRELNPKSAIFSFSLLRKFFKSKSIYNDKSFDEWDMKSPLETDAVVGAAFMISKNLFNKIGGFDKKIFLYFEENDISRRVKKLGYKMYVLPDAKIMHLVGQSTKYLVDKKTIFEKSRFYYLKKNFGIAKALLAEAIIRFDKYSFFITSAIAIGLFLRLLNINNGMSFIGDQGWFYISARDMLTNGQVPLVGITSSHLWLHQGPVWTYLLALILPIFNFNPVSGAYLTILFGAITIYLIYKTGSEIFNQKLALIAAFLYSVSPAIVFSDRMPFDPSPIPTFTIIYFYACYKWIKGNALYFPIILFCIAILYNLELATFSLFIPLLIFVIYGILKNKIWIQVIKTKKIITISLFSFIIPMLPILIYDFFNGFKQTVVFVGWLMYKPLESIFIRSAAPSGYDIKDVINFLFVNLSNLIFPQNHLITAILFILILCLVLYKFFKNKNLPEGLLLVFVFFGFLGIIINKTPSSAYLPILFPFVIYVSAYFINFLTDKTKIMYLILILLLISNFYISFMNDLKYDDLKQRIKATDKIIRLINGQSYNLIGVGEGSQFESFLKNYEYLLWWKRFPISKNNEKIKIFLKEKDGQILVTKKIYN